MLGNIDNPWKVRDSYGLIHFLSPERCLELNLDLDTLERVHCFYKEGGPCLVARLGNERRVIRLEDLE